MLQLIIEVILVILVQVFMMVGLVLRWLPDILKHLRNLSHWMLVISANFYQRILNRLQPLCLRFNIDLLQNPWRGVACVVLSLLIGVPAVVLAGWHITPLVPGICIAHGLIVAIIWDQLGPPGGISLGV